MKQEEASLLVVDDKKIDRDMLARRLQRSGYSVKTADGGKSALELIETQTFDLVLLDIMMPDLSGSDVLKVLRQNYSSTELPIIMVTAKHESTDMVRALGLGANDYITKPIDFDVLKIRVEIQIALKQRQEAYITEAQQLTEDLDYKSSHDGLTGLLNRKEFERYLNKVMGEIKSDVVEHILCYMDVDQFKVINDTYGHIAGDELLRQVSRLLEERLRKRDTVARLGGDEFSILLEYCTLKQAQRVLDVIRDSINEFRFHWEGKKLAISASIGVVIINKQSGTPTAVLSQVDAACFAAKDAGRNCIHVYNEAVDGLGRQREDMRWVERINQALEEDRFYLYYQPIVPINGKAQERHFELLIRMKDESGKIIPPGDFLPAADRFNLSSKIDRWVIQTAFSWLQASPEMLEREYCWGINLSGQSLADEELQDFVLDQLERKQILPERICFEITETATIANLNYAIRFITALMDQGCRFALDDFGSGLSSFAYLKNLPVDFLKIDGAFVKHMCNDPIDFAMVKAINDVGKAMGKKTIAEFVENDEIITKLKHIGVDYAQGYGISKPQSLTEFASNKGFV